MRIAIQQPALPAYRVPLFRALTQAMPEHDITLYFGSEEPELSNAAPDGFAAQLSPFKRWMLPIVGEVRWHPVQWALVDGMRADVVVLSWNIRAVSFWLALGRAKINKVPVVIWGHGYSKTNRNTLVDFVRSLPVRLSAAAVFYDANTAAGFEGGRLQGKVHVASNGLDSDAIQSARENALQRFPRQSDVRKHLKINDGPVLIHVGRLMEANRLDLLIDSLVSIVDQHPNTTLVIVGKGDDYQEELKELVVARKLDSHVVWVGPVYNESELALWMLAANVFVYPCNVGLSLIHAFNYALPAVICAPLSQHNPEVAIVVEGVNTHIASEQSTAALSTTLMGVLADPVTLQVMGQSALRAALETHNVKNMADTFKQVFDGLVVNDLIGSKSAD